MAEVSITAGGLPHAFDTPDTSLLHLTFVTYDMPMAQYIFGMHDVYI